MSPFKAKKHPMAGKPLSGADMILQILADQGVDTVFGYNGGAILPTYDAVFRFNAAHERSEQIQLVVPAQRTARRPFGTAWRIRYR
jgi:acetolactate synthase-1/2/3 large subunit